LMFEVIDSDISICDIVDFCYLLLKQQSIILQR